MMHGREKSDPAIVAKKPANNAGQPAAERVERRAGTEGNAGQQSTRRAQDRESVSQALERVRQAAKQRRKERFTALFHHINSAMLRTAFFALKRDAAAGVDGVTWRDYEADLDRRIEDLSDRVHRGAYRAQPSRRRYIPKPDGRQRPLAVAALEDKVVQRATTALLNAIYEEEFLGFSYGSRPGRGQHDALDALHVGIDSRKVNHILDADITGFFDAVSQDWLIRFVEHRIGDPRIIRLIRKWLKAGVLEDGVVTTSERGTGQGSVISPLLANIYLHHVFDLWAARWRRREATGDMVIVRYADDIVVGFEHEAQDWLIRIVEHRIGDPRIIRLIHKWLKAGVLEDGVVTTSERGTGQGSVISPLLANIYLHHVFDLWAARWRRREATGDMVIVRYADDIVVGFEHEADGRRFLDMMRERLAEFALTLHPEKTRLITFGRLAAAQRAKLGLGKPETFDFLGFSVLQRHGKEFSMNV